ncbi:hypothetical protein [Luteipulveratus halotolerans]|uniref:Uncharacterized protein n=1 Tax=Luteipulveratus halotolerans TaxID=1631356 RepID=A0A0L6CJW0_9MICO|nr:hypothetical protein [Luteipulveratus halotolerans]KNX38072.1 hypothetical protein VV01_14440 [Luteipulveratus halotolerans]
MPATDHDQDKKTADALRVASDYYAGPDPVLAAGLREDADKLDPATAEHPNGTLAVVTYRISATRVEHVTYATRLHGAWFHASGFLVCSEPAVVRVEVIPTVPEGHRAVRNVGTGCPRSYSATLRANSFDYAADVLDAYLDAEAEGRA